MLTRCFDFLHYQLQTYPNAKAFNYKVDGQWKSWSSQDAVDIVNRISLGLVKLGIKKDDKVAIVSTNRPEWNFIDFGIQQIGAISVPVYPTITIPEFNFIFDHSETMIIFVETEDLYKKVVEATKSLSNVRAIFTFNKMTFAKHWTEVEELGRKENVASLDAHRAAVKPEDLLTLIYTSGTTGRPKGVMLTHSNIVSNALAVRRAVPQLTDRDTRTLSFLPLCHIFERTALHFFTYIGASIFYAENMEKIAENIRETKPNVFTTVPRLLEKVYDKIYAKGAALTGAKKKLFFWALDLGLKYEPHLDMGFIYNLKLSIARKLIFSKWQEALGGQLKMIITGASALQPRLGRVFWAAGIPILEAYGLTETSPGISANRAEPHNTRIGTVGQILEGVTVKIAEDGEILCKGPNIMLGYYKDKEQTDQVIDKEGWFHTGDIGEFVDGKFLKITDRKKEMFKTSGGKYIAPQLMENKFKESFLIEQIMVTGENQKFPSALIVPMFDGLRDWCKENDIPYTTNEEMIKHPKVLAKYQEEIDHYNHLFAQWEKIKKFVLAPTTWGVDSGELTPTMKLKRRVVHKKFENEIKEIYGER